VTKQSDNDWPHSTPPCKADPPANAVGIVIPVRDGLKFLKLNLYSVLYFTSHPYVLTVVDNLSGLKTKQFLRSFEQNHAVDVLRYDEPFNFAAEANLGLRNVFSRGAQFGLVLNADAVVEPDWLGHLVDTMLRNKEAAAVGPISQVGNPEQMGARTDELYDVRRLSGFCMMIRKSAFEQSGGFDESFLGGGFEDWDLSQRLLGLGWKLLVDRRVFVSHFHKGFRRLPEHNEMMLANRDKFFAKHPEEAKWVVPNA
jgi:GT2 family glycosyltransferase